MAPWEIVMLSSQPFAEWTSRHSAVTDRASLLRRPTVTGSREARPGERLDLSYLARGMTWRRATLIDLSDAKIAHLSASATIINEVPISRESDSS